ncbi:GH39 family glycosyl hydrolase [Paenibacillus rigui]|uniref:GH39 family glycosyl hydrolase n=1 Tax=Paenibacillus rigui TaxID=554312 RepID=UPI001C533A8F|nr:hypothetical protein [Paenibacillus rigui]
MTIQEINISQEGKKLTPIWNKCVGAGRANEGLRANWLEQLQMVVSECGFEYIRFHGLFHDDMFVYNEVNGAVAHNWQYVDELFDRLLDMGIRPFVEFGFTPKDLASGEGTVFWWKGNVTPPSSYEAWTELIYQSVQHWIQRYGIDEVLQWFFEVWNEPNLSPFWKGTRTQYYELYKCSVQAIKSIHPKLRVGGPATSNFVPDDRFDGDREDLSKHQTFTSPNIDDAEWRPVWVKDFLEYCSREQLPVDFVSCHPYPTDFALDGHGNGRNYSRSVEATRRDLTLLKRIVQESAFPEAEIHLTEWSSSPSPRDHSHDHLPAAAYVVKANLDAASLTDSLSYWTFTDVFEEKGAGASIFHGGFGMVNFQGIVKPTFHAYRFLNRLGDIEIDRVEQGIVTRSSKDGRIAALFYNYDHESVPTAPPVTNNREEAEQVQQSGRPRSLQLQLSGLKPNSLFRVEAVDEEHGYAIPLWKGMGLPEPPNREQTQLLKAASQRTRQSALSADENGVLHLNIELAPWSILLLKQV